MKIYKFDPSQNISSSICLVFIMVLSLFVAWYSLRTAEKVIDGAKYSPAFNLCERSISGDIK